MAAEEPCPMEREHAPHPEGYLEHGEWAEEMLKTHEQRKCIGCGLWAIWVMKPEEKARRR